MKESSRSDYETRINRVLDYIADHPEEELSLENMARLSAFSPYHFHRIFRAFTGESIGLYQRRIKLDRAAYELRYKREKSITDIAYSLGFNSSSSFNRAFRNQFGHTPGEERGSVFPEGGEIPSEQPESVKNIELADLPSYRVFVRRYSGSFSDGAVLEEWCSHIRDAERKKLIGENTRFLGMVFDTPMITDEDKCRYDCCITTEMELERDIKIIDGGFHACFEISCGVIADIYRAYDWIFGTWLPQSGLELSDCPSYEDYYNFRPGTERNEGEPKIYRICLPIVKNRV